MISTADEIDEIRDCARDLSRCLVVEKNSTDLDIIKSLFNICQEKQRLIERLVQETDDLQVVEKLLPVNDLLTEVLQEASNFMSVMQDDVPPVNHLPSFASSSASVSAAASASAYASHPVPVPVPSHHVMDEAPMPRMYGEIDVAENQLQCEEHEQEQAILRSSPPRVVTVDKQPQSSRSVLTTTSTVDNGLDESSRIAIDALRLGVEVKDRRYNFRVYKSCFLGSEAVTALVESGCAESRADAVRLGRDLALRFDLFEHVVQDHYLKDEYLFYRFKHSVFEAEADDEESKLGSFRTSSECSTVSEDDRSRVRSVVRALQHVEVKDRHYKLTKYRKCFIGSEAVDTIISSGCTSSREEAVALGRRAAARYDLFEHVTGDHLFKDDYLFYHFKSSSTSLLHFRGKHAFMDDYVAYKINPTMST